MRRLLAGLVLTLLALPALAQDYVIDNQPGATFRTELNQHLGAIVTQNARTTEPPVRFPHMVWADTSGAAAVIRYRNAANSGWAQAFRIDPSSTMWLGGVTTNAATITGGSINGTPIGATTASSGRFTGTILESPVPFIRFIETDGASTHNRTVLVQENNQFIQQTVNNAGGFVSTDYAATKGPSGVSSHIWSVNNTPRLEVSGNFVISRGGFIASGTSGSLFQGDVTVENGRRVFPPFTFSTAASDLGTPANGHWRSLYVQNSPFVFSDARLKHDIGDLAEAECRAAERIEFRRFRLNDGDGRWRFGVIAQEVIAALAAEGLDWQDYNLVTGSEATRFIVVYDELQSLKLACGG